MGMQLGSKQHTDSFWVNSSDFTVTSLESWLLVGIIKM